MKVAFHLFFFCLYVYVCYQDATIVHGKLLPIPYNFFSRFVWLTVIDLYLQTIYHFIGLIISLTSTRRHPIFDYFARAIVGPCGVAVTVLFWALYLFDPATLVADEMGRQILSMKWFNHGLHTLPIISTHLDILVWNHTDFRSNKILKGIATFCTLYIIDIHYVFYSSGFWAYPILGHLPLPFRALFIAVCIFIIFCCYLWLTAVHAFIHGHRQKSSKQRN